MKTVIDTLFLRRPPLNYLSPGICEVVFSSTGSPIIILPDFVHLKGPTGLVLTGAFGHRRLSWNAYPNALCYNIYEANCSSAPPESLSYTLIAECVADIFFDLPEEGCYRVSAITPLGETDLSDPICTCDLPPLPPFETPVLSRSGVILSWTVTGAQPTIAVVERSESGANIWSAYGSAPWSGTLHVNSDFDYRVRGFASGAPASNYSNTVNVPLHPTAVTWRDRVISNGGTLSGPASTRAQSDFCYYLDENSLRSSLIAINNFAPDSLIACLTPLFRREGAPPSGYVVWNANNFVSADLNVNGLKGNGIDKDLNTGIQPSTEYSPGTPASIFAYEFTTSLQISGHAMATLGCRANGNPEFCLFTNSEGGVSFSSIWDNSVSRAVSGLTPNPGFFLASRTDAATHTLYFANSANPWAAIGSSSVATIGTPPDSIQINVFSEPVSGLPGAFFYSDRRISCAGIGYGLTSEQGRLLYNGIHALRIAFGGGSV